MENATADDPLSWLQTLWSLIEDYEELVSIEDNWRDEIHTVMAWLAEDLGFDPSDTRIMD